METIVLNPKRECKHGKLKIYTEKVEGRLVPGIVRCFDCGEVVKKRVVLLTPEQLADIPPGAKVVIGHPMVQVPK